MTSKVKEACDRAVKETGGNREAAFALVRKWADQDAALREEIARMAVDHLLRETIDEVLRDGFSLDNPDALVEEVVRRTRRRHLRPVR